jgi:hypothetical protein
MRNKLTILGFVAALVVWFAVAVGTLLQLNEVADHAIALRAQSTPVAAARTSSAPDRQVVAAKAGARACASAMQ